MLSCRTVRVLTKTMYWRSFDCYWLFWEIFPFTKWWIVAKWYLKADIILCGRDGHALKFEWCIGLVYIFSKHHSTLLYSLQSINRSSKSDSFPSGYLHTFRVVANWVSKSNWFSPYYASRLAQNTSANFSSNQKENQIQPLLVRRRFPA